MTNPMQGYCHECQLKRGGVPPKWNKDLMGVTVCEGICRDCKLITTLVPSADYDWPKTGEKAILD